MEYCRHSLNNYDVYGLFIGDEELGDLSPASSRNTLE